MTNADLWYKQAIIYAVDVATFQDGNADGIGDFPGLTARLDYLAWLGVTCIWLLPFYPSPDHDNGYDVVDHCAIDPRFGTLTDFDAFVAAAEERGIRVIVDLLANHTSDQHPWFQRSRSDPAAPERDYYVWAEQPPADSHEKVIFPGVEESNWAFDEVAGAYYWHSFYTHEPDLNYATPAVRAAMHNVIRFWLGRGVAGFRVDAAPYVGNRRTAVAHATVDEHEVLRGFRRVAAALRPDAVLIGETDVEPHVLVSFFGEGAELQMLFNFLLNNYLFLAFAREEADPLRRGLEALPAPPDDAQWANFLRNLDELDLERLTEAERGEVCAAFGPEERMRIYDRGLRRRLAPMLAGDRRRIELAYSLLLTLPGSPVIVYGDEIGMGEDLSLPERNSVRTPMQWSAEANGGFSTAPPQALPWPVIADAAFGYERVNVAAQRAQPDSLLAWMQRAIAARRQCPELGHGAWRILETGDPAVLALRSDGDAAGTIALHNLSAQRRRITLVLSSDEAAHMAQFFPDRSYTVAEAGRAEMELDGYGHRWFRIGGAP